MRPAVDRYLRLCRTLLVATVGICLLISAQGLHANHGFSFYGHSGFVVVPFAVGLSAVATVAVLTGRLLPTTPRRAWVVKYALYAFAVLLLGIVATPDSVDLWFYRAHVAVSALLFAGEFFLTAWLTLVDRRDWTDALLFGALLAVGLVAMASQLNWIAYLFVSEVAFQAIFLVILTRVVGDLERTAAARTGLVIAPAPQISIREAEADGIGRASNC